MTTHSSYLLCVHVCLCVQVDADADAYLKDALLALRHACHRCSIDKQHKIEHGINARAPRLSYLLHKSSQRLLLVYLFTACLLLITPSPQGHATSVL